MPRLFVAAWPTAGALAELAALPRPDEPGVRWVPPERWHVTLRFLGNADVDEGAAALRGLPLAMGPVVAELGPAVSRLGRSVICVPCAGLDRVAAMVVEGTAGLGRPPDPRPFAGHVTLARISGRGACGLAGHRIAATFPVDEVTLVVSEAGPNGPRYTVVDRVPITEGP